MMKGNEENIIRKLSSLNLVESYNIEDSSDDSISCKIVEVPDRSFISDAPSPIKAFNYNKKFVKESSNSSIICLDESTDSTDASIIDSLNNADENSRENLPIIPISSEIHIIDLVDSPSTCSSSFTQSKDSNSSIKNQQESKQLIFEENIDDQSLWKMDPRKEIYFLKNRYYQSPKKLIWPEIVIPVQLYDKLYDHQKVGIQWMASLHAKRIGGILGDDMGLGKTMQTLSLIGGLMKTKTVRNALIICPVVVLRNWEKEALDILLNYYKVNAVVRILESTTRPEKRATILEDALSCTTETPHLVVSTYGLMKTQKTLNNKLFWDYVILDEGHQIKNTLTKQHQICKKVAENRNTHRLLLTGTPIQNNMKELWALFDWATSGRILGPYKRFLNEYAIPIENGRNKNASEWTLKNAERANQNLQSLIRPFFIQRLKNVEFKHSLPSKTEYVVWTHLSDKQRQLYEKYVTDSGKVAAVLSGEIRSPLEAITWLKKLCGHPCLVSEHAGLEKLVSLRKDSGKLDVLFHLVKEFKKSGHRCLIFSQSTKMLDIMERILPFKLGRIDGTVSGKSRQIIVDKFNKADSKYDALLLSTKAAGVGLTLTGADRAIVYDPSWNPADDSQAVDRCYRIGQQKNVVVYRLITSGTVEEKMYEKQVHKDGLRRTVTTSSGCATERYFSEHELQKLFELMPRGVCEMLDKINAKYSKECAEQMPSLNNHQQVVGISSHDAVYTNTILDVEQNQSPLVGSQNESNITMYDRLDSQTREINFDEVDSIKSRYNTGKENTKPSVSLKFQNVDQVREAAVPLGKSFRHQFSKLNVERNIV